MTIKEFEERIEDVKQYESSIRNLEKYLHMLNRFDKKDTGIVIFYDENTEENTEFNFPMKNISKMTLDYLKELKTEYKEAIKKLNQCGLNIEADKDIIGE